MKQSGPHRNLIPINLQFSERGKPSYLLFPGVQIPAIVKMSDDFQTKTEDLIGAVLGKFFVNYIPADKDLRSIYQTLVVECVKQEIADQIGDFISEVRDQAEAISQEINTMLVSLGMRDINVFFDVPPAPEDFIAKFDLTVTDRSLGDLFEKSTGMQWLIIACCIAWLSKSVARRSGIRCIWLIEEPESYLHPELFAKQKRIFDEIGKHANVIYTTHSVGFVTSAVDQISGVFYEDGKSTIITFPTYEEAIQKIKAGLGVRFSDYFRLSDYNIAVEGTSDRDYLNWFLALARKNIEDVDNQWPRLLRADIHAYGGVSNLGGFIRANYRYIREEVSFIAMFDGDGAGKNETDRLDKYLNGNGIQFEAGLQYIILPNGFPIEGLFPHHYLLDCIREHSSWFERKQVDTEGRVVAFKVFSRNKESFAKTAKYRAEKEEFATWSEPWIKVCNALERCLQYKRGK